MENALERLDSLIIKRIAPKIIEKTPFTGEQLIYSLISAGEECDRIRIHLLLSVEKIQEPACFERLLRHYQNSLVHLMDTLAGYKSRHASDTLNELYDKVSAYIGDLLQYLQERFTEFDIESKVPDIAQAVLILNLRDEWDCLQQCIGRHGINEDLIKAATEPIRLFFEGSYAENVTYRWYDYMRDLLAELGVWANSIFKDPEWEMISLLLYMDLNSRRCRAACVKYIVDSTDGMPDPLNKLEQLLKDTRRLEVKSNTVFDSGQTSLKEHLLEWISTEIDFTRRKLPAGMGIEAEPEEIDHQLMIIKKVLIGLNVPEQGGWIRAQMEAGAILNKDLKEVTDVLTPVYETKHTANPSSDTMWRKSGALPMHSLRKLQRMARAMDKYFTDLLKG